MKQVHFFDLFFVFFFTLSPLAIAEPTASNAQEKVNELELLVTDSKTPKAMVSTLMFGAQFFALLGVGSYAVCQNPQAIDIEIWAAASVYYSAFHISIIMKEKKIAENAVMSANMADGSQLQTSHLENILATQRDAIKLMKKRTNLLQNIAISYYAAIATLAALQIMMNVPKNLGCYDFSEAKLFHQWETLKKYAEKALSIYGILSYLKPKTTSHFYLSPEAEFENSRTELQLLNHIFSFLFSNALAQDAPMPPTSPLESLPIKSVETTASGVAVPQDIAFNDGKAHDLSEFISKKILSPVGRFIMYGVMGATTQWAASRSRTDIKEYEALITDSEKQLNILKAATSSTTVESSTATPTATPTALAASRSQTSEIGCMRTVKNKHEYDPTCACKKDKSCTSFGDKYAGSDVPKETKELIARLDKAFQGDPSDLFDEKKTDDLLNRSIALSDKSLGDVNKMLASTGQSPVNFKAEISKAIKANSASKTLAFNSTASKKTTTAKTSGSDDYSLPSISSASKNTRGGIVFREELPADIPLSDINTSESESVFDILSTRYMKSAYPLLLQGKK